MIPLLETVQETDFEKLFTTHYAALARVLYRVVGETAQAEDLAAEAFWKLHRQPPRSQENLAGWLYRTGFRLALDDLKKRRRREHYEAAAGPPGSMPDPERALEQVQVRAVMAALKPEQTSLLVLRSEGHTLREIAALLDLNAGSVGTMLARADAAFRKEYVRCYGER